jgi:hypothetical protein
VVFWVVKPCGLVGGYQCAGGMETACEICLDRTLMINGSIKVEKQSRYIPWRNMGEEEV